jgi:hypothetical protein
MVRHLNPRTLVLGACSLLAASTALAQQDRPVGSWWFGADAGYAALSESYTGEASRDGRFTLNLRGGVVAMPRLLVGGELGGFLLESGNFEDPAKGRGISQIFGVVQYYLGERRAGFYMKAGGGFARFWGSHPTDVNQGGTGVSLAVGYDILTRESGGWGPVLSYTTGSIGSADYNAVSLSLAWTYQ